MSDLDEALQRIDDRIAEWDAAKSGDDGFIHYVCTLGPDGRLRIKRLDGMPADMGNGFQSYWLRDAQHEQWDAEDVMRDIVETFRAEVNESDETEGLQRGDIVEVDKLGDPNHGRDGPIWRTPAKGEETAQVWWEDGVCEFPQGALKPTGEHWNGDVMDSLPVPSGPGNVDSVKPKGYLHPYRVHAVNFRGR